MVIHFRIRWHGKYLQHFRMVPANTSEWLQLPTCFALMWHFLRSTIPTTVSTDLSSSVFFASHMHSMSLEVSCLQTSERRGALQNKVLPFEVLSTTQRICFDFSVLLLPQNPWAQNFLLLGRNTPKKSFGDLDLEFQCSPQLVFQHLLSFLCRPKSLSHLLPLREDGLADTIAFFADATQD